MSRNSRLSGWTVFPVLMGCGLASCRAAEEPALIFPKEIPWFNAKALTEKDIDGKVVLIDFWCYTCVNCIRTLPYVKEWHNRYAKHGLVIIGVHAPEFEFEKTDKNLKAGVEKFALKYPVVMDNDMYIWRCFDNHYWPAKYIFSDGKFLLDQKGGSLGGANQRARYQHFGEGEYQETEQLIQDLLKAKGVKAADLPPLMKPVTELDAIGRKGGVCYPVTAELYTNHRGYQQDQWGMDVDFGRARRYRSYEDPGVHQEGKAYLKGTWELAREYARHPVATKDYEDYLAIRYKAVEVNAVIHLHEGEGPVLVKVTLDGKPLPKDKSGDDIVHDDKGDSFIKVSAPRMYHIVKSKVWGIHDLAMYPKDSGFAVYAFTFGSCLKPGAEKLVPNFENPGN